MSNTRNPNIKLPKRQKEYTEEEKAAWLGKNQEIKLDAPIQLGDVRIVKTITFNQEQRLNAIEQTLTEIKEILRQGKGLPALDEGKLIDGYKWLSKKGS